MFKEMVSNGIVVDEIVFLSVFSVCVYLFVIKEGRLVYGLVVKIGIDFYINL